MPKRLVAPTVSRHFQFFEEDLLFLDARWGPRSPRGIAMNEIVRNIVHDAVKAARALEQERVERTARLARAEEEQSA